MTFLGRTVFDPCDFTWSFKDGSGKIPEEMREDLYTSIEDRNVIGANGASVLGTLFSWKERLEADKQTDAER